MSPSVLPSRRALLALLPAGVVASVAPLRAAGLLPSALRPQQPAPSEPRLRAASVVVVRHAEKADAADPDTELSERGHARAAALARLLAASAPTHAFASEFRRTQQTLAPLVDAGELAVETVPARDTAALVARLTRLEAGAVAVVAGHSNTVPALVTALGGALADLDPRGFLREDEYDRVALLNLVAPTDDAPLRALQTLDLRLALEG